MIEILDHLRATLEGTEVRSRSTTDAVAALIYLENPYDREFDAHGDPGLDDDPEILHAAHERLRAQRARSERAQAKNPR